ncbi:hypothetical protein SAMN02746041_00921 [Desulfacinum hydrothermale DSM 13146]|uniref:DUF2065 domain-containing protein n=1 Tax=Desulfacinum hydrothermale DSM 13146 TaxID=1121390 RepID=A0A1W1X9C6_9BACT|nr:DUF2065 domain-containing protein [Desulfacinum hydrothermale]SMC20447.1 hypothetical protein SAMN02746041_00921 [Desulfacinum hydrothermale DSM 13146]
MDYLLTALGLVCFLEGLPYAAFPDRIKQWLKHIARLPSDQLRLMGGVLMAVGLGLVYLGRRHGAP